MVRGLVVRSSSIHAAGCYTSRPIKKGTPIIEYDGPRFSKNEADVRYQDRIVTYLFSSGVDGEVIDGFGTAMFINHSCDANCYIRCSRHTVEFYTRRALKKGDELTANYGETHHEGKLPCHCCAANCRGYL